MLRKGIIFLILTSMMLHCASRMNFLSYLYEQREEIALTLGLIDEIPIATCNHDYEFYKGLKIVTQEDTDKSRVPSTLSQAREIILFFQLSLINVGPRPEVSIANHLTILHQKKYNSPGFPIFHPPA